MTVANLITGGVGPGSSIAGLILGGLEGAGGTATISRTGISRTATTLLIPNRNIIAASRPTIWADAAVGFSASAIVTWTTRGKLTVEKRYVSTIGDTRPTLNATGLNNLPTAEFGGSAYVRNLQSDFVTGYTGRVVAIAKTTVTDAAQVIYSQADFAAADQYLHLGISADNKIWYTFDNGSTVGVVSITGNTVLGSDWHVLEWACNDYGITMWVDGTEQTNTVASGVDSGYWFSDVTDTDWSMMGACRVGGVYGTYLTGSIATLLVYSPDKTAAAAAKVRRYEAAKYGVTLS